MENWKPVPDWPEYEVSDLGRVRRIAPAATPQARVEIGRIRKPNNISGYQALRLTRKGQSQTVLVHRLVARAFLGEPEPGQEVNHKDSDRWNPRLENLEWVTRSQNRQHGYDHGSCDARGERNGHCKMTEAGVQEIRSAAKADYQDIAKRHGVSLATVYDIAARRTWRHLP